MRGWVPDFLSAVVSSSSFVNLIISNSVLAVSGSEVFPEAESAWGRDLDLWR